MLLIMIKTKNNDLLDPVFFTKIFIIQNMLSINKIAFDVNKVNNKVGKRYMI